MKEFLCDDNDNNDNDNTPLLKFESNWTKVLGIYNSTIR